MKYSDAFDDLVQFFAAYRQADRNDASPILTQHTGLKDSEGNPIYEGDLISNGRVVLEVVFNRGGFGGKTSTGGFFTFSDLLKYESLFNIISNIYENPELLNEPQNKTIGTD